MTLPAAQPPQISIEKVKRYAWIALIVALVLAVWGVATRVHSRSELDKLTSSEAVPVVITGHPQSSPPSEELVLPGNVQAFIEAPIYARTSGYLRKWYTDIGTPVKKGELLAEIDTPEVDQQLRQSRADLATARANAQLAESTHQRWKGLLANHAVSQQDADTRAADAAASRAAAAGAEANVARLQELETFKRVVAPFDGVVTGRNTDIGALINAGQSAGSWLFRVADTNKLRIYVDVPESYAARTTVGLQADLHFNEHPGKVYAATLVRTAQALNPNLRTLQVELQVDNNSGELFPGSYAEVHFKLPGSTSTVRIPATALVFRAQGLQVATIEDGSRVRMKQILQGRDFGTSVDVLSGLSASDEIVVNPPDSLADGSTVRIRQPPAQGGAAPRPAARAP
ncbi:MAG TPA: efflux RND transporter periplasmic adaptor subunit [Steroidobacteraceae bacterium]|nr:efflux RND transporter periplasmic adaptor subunit [Steroidobacteraceae bacterium]